MASKSGKTSKPNKSSQSSRPEQLDQSAKSEQSGKSPETDKASKTAKIEHRDRILTQLNLVAPVTARAMFGGYGLYCSGVMLALIAYERLYFKVDDANINDYINAGMSPFTYTGKGKPIAMSYYELPESVFQEPEQLLVWLEKSQAAARRAKQAQSKPTYRSPGAK
jgi:DNA transformation protein